MTNELINKIKQKMQAYLGEEQMRQLHEVLCDCLSSSEEKSESKTVDLIQLFLAAKRVEGCSNKTVHYYESTIRNAVEKIDKDVVKITTDDLRMFLDGYQEENNISKVTVDNIRRILSSFFAWLEDEDYIVKSPVRRIHKVKTCKTVKETYTDEALEIMRDECDGLRDLAMIDLLASTGMRVGELVKLNRDDIDFENRECVVLGKGNKQRKVYFDARTKLHLQFIEMFGLENEGMKTIGDVASICRGSSPRPISKYVTDDPEGVNWIKIGDAGEDDVYIIRTSEKITQDGAKKSRAVKPGDFILSNSMSFGRPYILGIDGCVHDGWLIISDYQDYLDPMFFYYELRSDLVQRQFDGSANGSTVKNLNSDRVSKVKIHIPSMELQSEFVELAKQSDKSKFYG